MKLFDRFRAAIDAFGTGPTGPRAATQSAGGGITITTPQDLEKYIREYLTSTASGMDVTPNSAMKVAAVYGSVRIISGAVATMPLSIYKRVSADVRQEVEDHWLTELIRRRPNKWQTPSQFRRMQQSHVLLRGNAYALKINSLGRVIGLIPLHPDRVRVDQLDDLTLAYTYTRKDSKQVVLPQSEIMHWAPLTLDGVHGVTPLTYARESIGLSLAQDEHGASTFRNGARIGSVLSHPGTLGKEGTENLRASLEAYRRGGESEGKDLILEENMTVAPISMTSADAQWVESRKLSRTDIMMFFGVPPHMLGDTEKTTSFGSGIESMSTAFVAYTLEDYLTTWEEVIARDLIPPAEKALYAKFNRAALVRADYKTRVDGYVKLLQWGVVSPNEVRALEDLNPRPDGLGDKFYPPPNTAGVADGTGDPANEPAQAA